LTTLHHHNGGLTKLPRQLQGEARVADQQKMLFMPPPPGTLGWNCRISAQSLLQQLLHAPIPARRHAARQRIPGGHEDASPRAVCGE